MHRILYFSDMKRHTIYVKPYVLKFVKPQLGTDGVFVVPNRLVLTYRNSSVAKTVGQESAMRTVKLTIECAVSSLYVIHALQASLAKEFREQMFASMATAVKLGKPALAACKAFLDTYGIDPHEYDWTSAYRSWERNKDRYLDPQNVVPKLRAKGKPSLKNRQLSIFDDAN
jgi:hypothetical protein